MIKHIVYNLDYKKQDLCGIILGFLQNNALSEISLLRANIHGSTLCMQEFKNKINSGHAVLTNLNFLPTTCHRAIQGPFK